MEQLKSVSSAWTLLVRLKLIQVSKQDLKSITVTVPVELWKEVKKASTD